MTREELIRIAHDYYPKGFPPEQDDYTQRPLAFQRTPEFQRWSEAWKRAMAWEQWATLHERLQEVYPGHLIGGGTTPWMSACRRCYIYFSMELPEGGTLAARLVCAASILVPLHLIYMTRQIVWTRDHAEPQQLFMPPPEEMKSNATVLTEIVEEALGYRPFPLELADVPLPGLRVLDSSERVPTLLDALIDDREQLANLP